MPEHNGAKDLHAYVATTRKQVANFTGIGCQQCKQAVVEIESETPDHHFVFKYPACGHGWSTDQPPKR